MNFDIYKIIRKKLGSAHVVIDTFKDFLNNFFPLKSGMMVCHFFKEIKCLSPLNNLSGEGWATLDQPNRGRHQKKKIQILRSLERKKLFTEGISKTLRKVLHRTAYRSLQQSCTQPFPIAWA